MQLLKLELKRIRERTYQQLCKRILTEDQCSQIKCLMHPRDLLSLLDRLLLDWDDSALSQYCMGKAELWKFLVSQVHSVSDSAGPACLVGSTGFCSDDMQEECPSEFDKFAQHQTSL